MKLPIDDETWHRVIRSEKLKSGKKKMMEWIALAHCWEPGNR